MLRKGTSLILSLTMALFWIPLGRASTTFAVEKEPYEIIELRTEFSKSYDNGDGTITSFIDTVPVHYDDNGQWVDIDNSLILDDNGNYTNKNNSMNVILSSVAYFAIFTRRGLDLENK